MPGVSVLLALFCFCPLFFVIARPASSTEQKYFGYLAQRLGVTRPYYWRPIPHRSLFVPRCPGDPQDPSTLRITDTSCSRRRVRSEPPWTVGEGCSSNAASSVPTTRPTSTDYTHSPVSWRNPSKTTFGAKREVLQPVTRQKKWDRVAGHRLSSNVRGTEWLIEGLCCFFFFSVSLVAVVILPPRASLDALLRLCWPRSIYCAVHACCAISSFFWTQSC